MNLELTETKVKGIEILNWETLTWIKKSPLCMNQCIMQYHCFSPCLYGCYYFLQIVVFFLDRCHWLYTGLFIWMPGNVKWRLWVCVSFRVQSRGHCQVYRYTLKNKSWGELAITEKSQISTATELSVISLREWDICVLLRITAVLDFYCIHCSEQYIPCVLHRGTSVGVVLRN